MFLRNANVNFVKHLMFQFSFYYSHIFFYFITKLTGYFCSCILCKKEEKISKIFVFIKKKTFSIGTSKLLKRNSCILFLYKLNRAKPIKNIYYMNKSYFYFQTHLQFLHQTFEAEHEYLH